MGEVMEAFGGLTDTGQRAGLPLTLWQVACIQQARGRKGEAFTAVETALDASKLENQRFWDAELLRLEGDLLRSKDEARAEPSFRRATPCTWINFY